jgi:hypothetical protein
MVEEHDEQNARKGYITRLGAERLHAELLRLLNVERPKVTAEVSAAAAQGDRSENAEYIYGSARSTVESTFFNGVWTRSPWSSLPSNQTGPVFFSAPP